MLRQGLGPWAQAMPEHMDIGGLWWPILDNGPPGPLGPWAQAMLEHVDIGGLWWPILDNG